MREAMMEELVKEVQEIAGEEYELTVSEKRKNNGTVYTAVEVYKKRITTGILCLCGCLYEFD